MPRIIIIRAVRPIKKSLSAILILIFSVHVLSREQKKNLLTDIALTYGITFAYVLVITDLRKNIFTKYSICQVIENFKDPINRAIEGSKTDTSHFLTNYLGHPLSFAGLALYLKARGYSNVETILFTQIHSIIWEYAIEGGIWYPSGKDLITDFIGAMAGIYLLHPLSNLGERELNSGNNKFIYHFFYFLNPFKTLNRIIFGKKNRSKSLYLVPKADGVCLSFICAF